MSHTKVIVVDTAAVPSEPSVKPSDALTGQELAKRVFNMFPYLLRASDSL
jgi:hypothetical protein